MTLVQTATILIVEDEVIIAETLSAMLKNMGCRVSKIAHNLDEFRRAFQHGNLDFVFLDINLNGQHEGLRLAS